MFHVHTHDLNPLNGSCTFDHSLLLAVEERKQVMAAVSKQLHFIVFDFAGIGFAGEFP